MNMSELSDLWIKGKKNTIKKTSIMQYDRIIHKYIDVYIGDIDIEQLGIQDIIYFCNNICLSLSHKSMQDIIVVLKSILNYGNMMNYCHFNLNAIPSYRIKRKKVKVMSSQDLYVLENYLINHINNKNIGLLICLYTGIRLGEICALSWDNILLDEDKIIIDKSVYRISNNGKSYTEVGMPKTEESIREVPINKKLYDVLVEYKEKRGYVLTGNYKYLDPRSYQYYFKNILKQLDLDNYNFHVLRHTFATKCVECQVDIKSLSEILGHTSVNITLNVYVHSSFSIKKTQLNKLNYL